MTTNAQHTPGQWVIGIESDWSVDTDSSNSFIHIGPAGCDPVAIAVVADFDWDNDERLDANARLIAAAPDHASIGWAMCVAGGRWEPWGDGRGEFCLNGIRHSTRLDQFGVPEMTDALRAAILKATGEPK